MSRFAEETSIVEVASGRWQTELVAAWNIGDTANGGYVAAPVVRALASLGAHADPVSVTTHFLRPVRPDGRTADIAGRVVKPGRTTTVTTGSLSIDEREHLRVAAVFGDLPGDLEPDPDAPAITLPAPELTSPDDCVDRAELAQGVELPILDRLDVRIDPTRATAGGCDDAVIEGWIRFADGADPTVPALVLFCDAFPPSLYPRLGRIGWVPTIELTIHVRRHPAPGWVQARLECDDLHDGWMVETGSLWDSTGSLVARSRQLGRLLTG